MESTATVMYLAKFDYDKERDDVLSFKKGDKFEVTHKPDDKWWAAKRSSDGAMGYVPALYLEPTKERIVGRLIPEEIRQSPSHLKSLKSPPPPVSPRPPRHLLKPPPSSSPKPISSSSSHDFKSPGSPSFYGKSRTPLSSSPKSSFVFPRSPQHSPRLSSAPRLGESSGLSPSPRLTHSPKLSRSPKLSTSPKLSESSKLSGATESLTLSVSPHTSSVFSHSISSSIDSSPQPSPLSPVSTITAQALTEDSSQEAEHNIHLQALLELQKKVKPIPGIADNVGNNNEDDDDDDDDDLPFHLKYHMHSTDESVSPTEEPEDFELRKPKPLPNPVLSSKTHQELHRELRMKSREGKREVFDKPELKKAFEARRNTQKMREIEEAKKKNRTSLDIKLMKQQEKLKEEEDKKKQETSIPEDGDKPEFMKVKLRHRADSDVQDNGAS
ncbi:uncharacterized protein LOC144438808 [Glandiceps talaboti]